MEEPYFHKNVYIDRVPSSQLEHLIAWSLEREHGDLNLGSTALKPPMSALGEAILGYPHPNRAQRLVEDIYEESLMNVAIAKARLDLIHTCETLGDLDTFRRRGRLPSNMVSMFEAGVKGIESQSNEQRSIGLKAIGALQRDEAVRCPPPPCAKTLSCEHRISDTPFYLAN